METVLLKLSDTAIVNTNTDNYIRVGGESSSIIVSGMGGPPGRDALTGALLITNKLSEYAFNTLEQEDVQNNIGLGYIDPLAYYILAKA